MASLLDYLNTDKLSSDTARVIVNTADDLGLTDILGDLWNKGTKVEVQEVQDIPTRQPPPETNNNMGLWFGVGALGLLAAVAMKKKKR